MLDLKENDLFRRKNRCDFIGPVYFGSSLDQTGLINFYNLSSQYATSFQAGNASADVTYTLPTTAPSTNTDVLQGTTAGALSWVSSPTFNGKINGNGARVTNLAVTATTGGTLAGGTYYYKVYPVFGSLVGSPSNEVSVVIGGANNASSVSWTAATGTTTYRVARGTASGSQSGYYTVTGTSYTDTNAAFSAAGAAFTQTNSNWIELSGNILTPGSSGGIYFIDYVDGSIVANISLTSAGEIQYQPGTNGANKGVHFFQDYNQAGLIEFDRSGTHAEIVFLSGNSLIDGDLTWSGSLNLRPDNATIGTISTSASTFNNQLIGKGTATNNSAAAGYIGEYITANLARTGTALTTATAKDVASISLTAGHWDLSGAVGFTGTATTTIASLAYIGVTSNTIPATSTYGNPNSSGEIIIPNIQNIATDDFVTTIPSYRVLLSATTTMYLGAKTTFGAGAASAYGYISATRRR